MKRCVHWIVVASLIVVSSPSLVSGQAGVRIGASFGYGAYAVEDINDFIDGTGDYWRDVEHEVEGADVSFSSEDLGGGAAIAATVEYMITNQISVGMELVPLSTDGEYTWRWEEWYYEESIYAREHCAFEARANLVSLFGIYRVPLGATGASARVGAGAGYLFSGTFESDYSGYVDYAHGGAGTVRQEEEWSGSLEASGSGMAFHALVGAEYPIGPQLVLTGDVTYRFASIEELEVDRVSLQDEFETGPIHPDSDEGKVLRWTDYGGVLDEDAWPPRFRTDRGSDVAVDFSGLYITFGIAYIF